MHSITAFKTGISFLFLYMYYGCFECLLYGFVIYYVYNNEGVNVISKFLELVSDPFGVK